MADYRLHRIDLGFETFVPRDESDTFRQFLYSHSIVFEFHGGSMTVSNAGNDAPDESPEAEDRFFFPLPEEQDKQEAFEESLQKAIDEFHP